MAFTLREYNEIAEAIGLPRPYRGAVVSIHGMNTRAAWQKHITPCLQDAQIRHVAVDFGWVLHGALLRKTPRAIAQQIMGAYEEQIAHFPHPGAIAHSLGSIALGTCLQSFREVQFRRIILFGSILQPDFPWRELSSTGQVNAVLNETSRSDPWPMIARFLIPDAGASGCSGFTDSSGLVVNREYAHSGHSGLEYRLHYKGVWIPFLRGREF